MTRPSAMVRPTPTGVVGVRFVLRNVLRYLGWIELLVLCGLAIRAGAGILGLDSAWSYTSHDLGLALLVGLSVLPGPAVIALPALVGILAVVAVLTHRGWKVDRRSAAVIFGAGFGLWSATLISVTGPFDVFAAAFDVAWVAAAGAAYGSIMSLPGSWARRSPRVVQPRRSWLRRAALTLAVAFGLAVVALPMSFIARTFAQVHLLRNPGTFELGSVAPAHPLVALFSADAPILNADYTVDGRTIWMVVPIQEECGEVLRSVVADRSRADVVAIEVRTATLPVPLVCAADEELAFVSIQVDPPIDPAAPPTIVDTTGQPITTAWEFPPISP